MNFKKRVNGSWTDIPHYIHKTDTDTLTTLPDVVYVNDTTATVGLKGNTIQSGTPTPDSPIMPQGTGERTGNLAWTGWAQDFVTRINNIDDAHIDGNILQIRANAGYSEYDTKYLFTTTWKENTQYTFSLKYNRTARNTVSSMMSIYYTDGTAKRFPNYKNDDEWHIQTVTSDANKTIKYVACFYSSGWLDIDINTFMVVEGITRPTSYEPYGYKLDISSANTITSVYLGEVETTRRIRKLVLDGTENWNEGTSNYYIFVNVSGRGEGIPNSTALSTHTESGVVVNNNGTTLFFKKSVFVHSSLADFKTYLQQQYANGTPVTVWYVLATEETAIVNEPLMKIGDYADEIINVNVPTKIGTNAFNIDTTVQPSEVTLNYHGWHPIANIHEHDNGAWN